MPRKLDPRTARTAITEIRKGLSGAEYDDDGNLIRTGFEVMVGVKERNLRLTSQIVKQNPQVSGPQVSEALGVSQATAKRYLAEVRENLSIPSGVEIVIQAKRLRMLRLVKYLKGHPKATRSQMRKHLSVSRRTLDLYLIEYRTKNS